MRPRKRPWSARATFTLASCVEGAIARIERLNPLLNAVITPLFDQARAAAAAPDLPAGPFRGVPLLLKDFLCHTAGDPYYEGMRFLRDMDWRATHDTYLAAKFRAAGFIILGKTNLPELAGLPITEPAAFGPTRNPWDLTRSREDRVAAPPPPWPLDSSPSPMAMTGQDRCVARPARAGSSG